MFKDDLICRMLQHISIKKTHPGKKANVWEPYQTPGVKTLENGIVCMNDIAYGSEFPNSFFDIWFPDQNRSNKKPAIVYFHGGGFCMGDKSSGDPLSTENQSEGEKEHSSMLMEMVKRGYIVINASYALAPQYRFPCQIFQTDQVFSYLKLHADEYGIDINRLILSGSSAGANMTEIYGACVAEPSYAKKLHIHPSVTTENLKVLLMDEAALETDGFNGAMDTMYLGWIGGSRKKSADRLELVNAKRHLKDRYIPSFINASNQEPFFKEEADAMEKKLSEIGTEHVKVYFEPSEGQLAHGYMGLMELNDCSLEAFETMMDFTEKHC